MLTGRVLFSDFNPDYQAKYPNAYGAWERIVFLKEDTTGLCTVRQAVAAMLEFKPPHNPMEMYFDMKGVRYNVEIKIIAVDGKAERRCPTCGEFHVFQDDVLDIPDFLRRKP